MKTLILAALLTVSTNAVSESLIPTDVTYAYELKPEPRTLSLAKTDDYNTQMCMRGAGSVSDEFRSTMPRAVPQFAAMAAHGVSMQEHMSFIYYDFIVFKRVGNVIFCSATVELSWANTVTSEINGFGLVSLSYQVEVSQDGKTYRVSAVEDGSMRWERPLDLTTAG
jgi:hypothetical protein